MVDTLVQRASAALDEYLAIHDNIFGGSLWRMLRRSVPIPGFFEAIPYAEHAAKLSNVQSELRGITQQAVFIRSTHRAVSPEVLVLSALADYAAALADSVTRLTSICDSLAETAAGAGGPSRREYQRAMSEYDRSRANSVRLGATLNEVLGTMVAAKPSRKHVHVLSDVSIVPLEGGDYRVNLEIEGSEYTGGSTREIGRIRLSPTRGWEVAMNDGPYSLDDLDRAKIAAFVESLNSG